MKHYLLIAAFAVLPATSALAAEGEGMLAGWSGDASISGSTTSGNTSTTDIGAALHLKKEAGKWTHNFDTTYDLGKAGGFDNKNRWYIGYQANRAINDKLYTYANLNYYTDDFGPFKQGSFAGAGFGYQVMKGEPMNWALEGGAGYRSQKTRESGIIPSFKTSEFALRGGSKLDYVLNESISLYNNSEIIWSESDTYIWNEAGLTANLAGNLAARFSFRIDTHSDVPVGIKKTDTITRASLVYTIK